LVVDGHRRPGEEPDVNTLRKSTIVVGVDESALAGQAVRWAAEQAALEGRSVRLVRAVRPVPSGRSDHAMPVQPGTFTSLRLHSEALLRQAHELAHRVAPDVEIEEQLEVTDPRTLLIDLAREAHLVVLGSRGRGPALSHLFGSVGISVARHAACPVVVHRPSHPGLVRDGVVVAVDATADSVGILEFAFRQASLRRLPIQVLHYARDPQPALLGSPLAGTSLGEWDDLALAEVMAGLGERYPDVHVRVRTAPGEPGKDAARVANRADLLVVGTHHRGVLERVVGGSVSTAILEHATCPVAVVPVP
jgi:nucleotide-binding universal stress UspA family protein